MNCKYCNLIIELNDFYEDDTNDDCFHEYFHESCYYKYYIEELGNYCCDYEKCDDLANIIQKDNVIEYYQNQIFNNQPNVKYNNKYYHFGCLRELLNLHFLCSKCKIYYNIDYAEIKDLNNKKFCGGSSIRVCGNCFNNSSLEKCCNGQYVRQLCFFYGHCGSFSQGCENCVIDWIDEYCYDCK